MDGACGGRGGRRGGGRRGVDGAVVCCTEMEHAIGKETLRVTARRRRPASDLSDKRGDEVKCGVGGDVKRSGAGR